LPLISEWQNRSLNAVYPVVFFDAMHCKVKQDGKIINKAVYICLGIDLDGMKDVLGMWIGDGSEGAKYWLSVFTELKNRGVEDILIACMDGLKGLPEAVKSVFPDTEIQLCVVHQIRNSTRYISWKHKKELSQDLKAIYQAPTEESAYENLQGFKQKWDSQYPIVGKSWEANWSNLSSFFKYPTEIRRIIYTTNALEGLNRQLRKYTKTKAVFTSDQALMKCLYLAQENISKKWTMSIRDWGLCLSQLTIHFEGRVRMN
jgi:putative transposase